MYCENRVRWYKHQLQTQSNTVMAQLIGAVTSVTSNFLEINQVSIDNWGFKLFYKATTTYLILSSVLATAKQFFGSPIQCDAGSVSWYFKKINSWYNSLQAKDGIEKEVLESYCWMYSTWNIPSEYKGACSGADQVGKLPLNLKSKKHLHFRTWTQQLLYTTLTTNGFLFTWYSLHYSFICQGIAKGHINNLILNEG